jgi:carboxylesterase type B
VHSVRRKFWSALNAPLEASGQSLMAQPYWKSVRSLEAGKLNDTPVLIGTNSNEGRLFATQKTTSAAFEQMVWKSYAESADLF